VMPIDVAVHLMLCEEERFKICFSDSMRLSAASFE
jgi:hypothetical protein